MLPGRIARRPKRFDRGHLHGIADLLGILPHADAVAAGFGRRTRDQAIEWQVSGLPRDDKFANAIVYSPSHERMKFEDAIALPMFAIACFATSGDVSSRNTTMRSASENARANNYPRHCMGWVSSLCGRRTLPQIFAARRLRRTPDCFCMCSSAPSVCDKLVEPLGCLNLFSSNRSMKRAGSSRRFAGARFGDLDLGSLMLVAASREYLLSIIL